MLLNLTGKKILVTGIANNRSIAWGIAQQLSKAGAELGITYLPDDKGRFESKVRELTEGYKPTVEGKTLNLEVHILNFDQDIYKSRIQVEFMRYLRGEKKFNGVNELKTQINLDIKEAEKYFEELCR